VDRWEGEARFRLKQGSTSQLLVHLLALAALVCFVFVTSRLGFDFIRGVSSGVMTLRLQKFVSSARTAFVYSGMKFHDSSFNYRP
jgi:hypothetical protein